MSGTSLDAVDVVAVSFEPQLQLHAHASYVLPAEIKTQILTLCSSGEDEIEKLGHLDISLGKLFADCCLKLIQQHELHLRSDTIAAIGLHGQTIRHRPANAPKHNFSLQIGDANTVAEDSGILTVADFRRRDIAAGGQGAPLVPAFHSNIFHSNSCNRAILNIGGMANITLLSEDSQQPLLGFDTGPGNVLMDAWVQQHKGLAYDANGDWAKEGKVQPALLQKLLELPFFSQPIPKSTGREQFNLTWIQQALQSISGRICPEDVQRTLLELSAVTICNEIKKQHFASAELYVCGGGAHNQLLMARLEQLLPEGKSVASTAALDLDPDWVEATAFAWLARQTLLGLCSNCATVTGARGGRILGAIFQA
ncbi:MAG: anhydro-N-acetylmuramic acid kinase [Osedax symbiont Rs2]|nr:MAG: anhydro-N-acetylmuramic acid kinase [Osedax symbiont Rs2]